MFVPAAALGLLPTDNLNAASTMVPGPSPLVGLASMVPTVGVLVGQGHFQT